MQYFGESSTPLPFSALERQVMCSGLSLAGILTTVEEFRSRCEHILGKYRDIARKCIYLIIKLRNAVTSRYFDSTLSDENIIDKLSHPITKERKYITIAERILVSKDLQILFNFLASFQKSHGLDDVDVDIIVNKMKHVLSLDVPITEESQSINEIESFNDILEENVLSLSKYDIIDIEIESLINIESSIIFMTYNGRLNTSYSKILRDAGCDAYGINVVNGKFMICVEGLIEELTFMNEVTQKEPKLRDYIIYEKRNSPIKFDFGLSLGE